MFKTRSWFVAMIVFTAITLFTPGCLTFEVSLPCADAMAMPSADAVTIPEDPQAQPPSLVDGGAPPSSHEDAGQTSMLPQDGATPTSDRSPVTTPGRGEHDVVAVVLAPTTCHGRRLGETTLAALGPFPTHHVLWHVCLKTPSRQTSDQPLASERAGSVSVHLVDSGNTMNEVIRATAPATANPWTASLLIALPIGEVPAFHARAHYQGGQALSLVRTDPADIHGEIRVWQVDSHGTQTERAPNVACEEPLDTSRLTGVFLPAGTCTVASQRCTNLPGFVCASL